MWYSDKNKKIRFNGLYGWEGRCISYLPVLLPLTGVVDPDKKVLGSVVTDTLFFNVIFNSEI